MTYNHRTNTKKYPSTTNTEGQDIAVYKCFKVAMKKKSKDLVIKLADLHKDMGNFGRNMETKNTPSVNEIEKLERKNAVFNIKNVLDLCKIRQDIASRRDLLNLKVREKK